jgi:hypothetical protein
MTDFHDRITPTHIDKPLIHKPKEKLCLTAPAMRIVVRVLLDRHKQFFLLEVAQYPVDGSEIERRSASKLSETVQKYAGLVEGRNRDQTFLLAKREIFFAATRGNVHDSGAFSFTHRIPGNHLWISRAGFAGPHLFHRYIGNFRWKPPG